MEKELQGTKVTSYDNVKNAVSSYFADKRKLYFFIGIYILIQRIGNIHSG